MKLTKYAHACMVLEEQGQKLIIDPGKFTPEFGDLSNIAAVIVTHVHQDHCNPEYLENIFATNPDAAFFTVQEVAEHHPKARVVQPGQTEQVGPFTLAFSGEMHAPIHKLIPHPHNTAVLVNGTFFYPGDSYTMPAAPVKLLAVPANAPWMKIADSMDYLLNVKAAQCIPTHNGLLSEAGNLVYNGGLQHAAETAGITFTYLQPGESIHI